MSTKNPKVSAYIPQHIYNSFKAFCKERDISMSQAVAVIFAEYFALDLLVNEKSPTRGFQAERLDLLEKNVGDLKKDIANLGDLLDKISQVAHNAVEAKQGQVIQDGIQPRIESSQIDEPRQLTIFDAVYHDRLQGDRDYWNYWFKKHETGLTQYLHIPFERTGDFEKFLDNRTCLIKGQKGTGKTALCWLFLQYRKVAQDLAPENLDYTVFLSAHSSLEENCLPRDHFQYIHSSLQETGSTWEAFWRAYLMMRCYQQKLFDFPLSKKDTKFVELRAAINNVSREKWQPETTQVLLQLSTDSKLLLIVKDAVNILLANKMKKQSLNLWLFYDNLDEIFPEVAVTKEAIAGLFQLVQSCDASESTEDIGFKIFLREDTWKSLNFDNKSHFTGRDITLCGHTQT
jgi:hypothetical protein